MPKRFRYFAFLIPFVLRSVPETKSTKQLFVQRCAVCHGVDAGGTDRGPALTGNRRLRTRSPGEIVNIIRKGTHGGMPGFALPDTEVSPLADYIRSLNATVFEVRPEGDASEANASSLVQGSAVLATLGWVAAAPTGPISQPSRVS